MTNEERIATIDKTLGRIDERVKNRVQVDGWQYLYYRDVKFLRERVEVKEGDNAASGNQ